MNKYQQHKPVNSKYPKRKPNLPRTKWISIATASRFFGTTAETIAHTPRMIHTTPKPPSEHASVNIKWVSPYQIKRVRAPTCTSRHHRDNQKYQEQISGNRYKPLKIQHRQKCHPPTQPLLNKSCNKQ